MISVYTKAGPLGFKSLVFPDGQPHIEFHPHVLEFTEVTIETEIASTNDLFVVQLLADVLRRLGYTSINLDIRYLMGARMDRVMTPTSPFTLDIVARTLNGLGLNRVRIFDPHSDAAVKLINHA